jgi:hypothetical protein
MEEIKKSQSLKNCTTPWEKPTKKKHHLSFVGILLPTFCFVLFCLIQTEEWYDWVLMLLPSIFG